MLQVIRKAMVVLKRINNNVAICRDNNQRELIAFGRGIGFPQMPYELSDLKKVERTFYNVSEQYLSLLSDIPYEVIHFTADQMQWVQDELPYELTANFILTLADHIAFAMEREKKGVYVRMPSVYELEINYPAEVKVGRKFLQAIRDRFKVKLPKGEIQGIAMHFINAQDAAREEKETSIERHYEEILQNMTTVMEETLHVRVKKDTFNYARFATHVEYLLRRVFEHKRIDSSNLALCRSVREEYPDVADCVDRICDDCKENWGFTLGEEERLYLMLHVNRTCSKETI